MKEFPILFNAEMVRAILDGRKTQTRRVIKYRRLWAIENDYWPHDHPLAPYTGNWPVTNTDEGMMPLSCPYGHRGDRLWVRETHYRWTGCGTPPLKNFVRDRCYVDHPEFRGMWMAGQVVTVPSIHMPRWASRLTLEVVSVRVERLQEISDLGILAEGIPQNGRMYDRWEITRDEKMLHDFRTLWDSINGKPQIERDDAGREVAQHDYSWNANPFVWVVEFKKVAP